MKKGNMMITLLISRKWKSTNLQVYLAPFLEDLLNIFYGVINENKSSSSKEKEFKTREI